jgi:hypothetical protein
MIRLRIISEHNDLQTYLYCGTPVLTNQRAGLGAENAHDPDKQAHAMPA